MKAAGEQVTLRYETDSEVVEGDFVVSMATGRTYVVDESKPMRGVRVGYRLLATVLPDDAEIEGDFHPMYWDKR